MSHDHHDHQGTPGDSGHHHAPGTPADFDQRARAWDDETHLRRAAAIAERIVQAIDIPAGARALDLGCGTGLGTWPIADRFAHITLADSSPGMLEVVRERLADRPDADKFTVRLLDATVDALEPASLDIVYTVLALHHVTPVEKALTTIHEGLAAGGTLAIADLDVDPDGAYHGHGFAGQHGFDRDDLASLLRQAGFRDVRIGTVYSVTKTVDGQPREFPVFLALATA